MKNAITTSIGSRAAVVLICFTTTLTAVANPLSQLTQLSVPSQSEQANSAQLASAQTQLSAMYAAAMPSQQACIQAQLHKQQQAARKKRGFGRLLRAVSRTATRSRQFDIVHAVNDVVRTGQTADDLISAATDLGLREDQVNKCMQ